MELKDVIDKKFALEKSILDLIIEFQKETSLPVNFISLDTIQIMGMREQQVVNVNVSVSL
jgi:hypothetical protein